MKITLISLDNWGLNANIADCLIEKGHHVTVIDFNQFKYKYPNFGYRILNFFLKFFFKKNLKFQYYGQKIISVLENKNENQDLIITIKADFIDAKSLILLKKFTNKSIAFFNDSISRYPDTKRVLHCFDEVYSFEKADCEKYNLKFKTNFIYDFKTDKTEKNTFKNQLFNISSRDGRTKNIIRIAKSLNDLKIKYNIIIFDEKNRIPENEYVEVIRKPVSLTDVKKMVAESKTVLDIHRENQDGLTFRVFESLGTQKKLVTTNTDIKNYDFYNPNNILIIDAKNPIFPTSFFETNYQNIPEAIINKYKIENWVDTFLN